MNKDEERDEQLKRLYEWAKEDNAITEALLSLVASAIVFAVLIGIIYIITILTL